MLDPFTAVAWKKSKHSAAGNCVEVAFADNLVGVRDSKDPQGRTLTFTPAEWRAFVRGVRDGEFDLDSL
jgi:Domain of unknown function (DUF397)